MRGILRPAFRLRNIGRYATCLLALAVCAASSTSRAAGTSAATTSDEARREAIRAIPLERVDASHRENVREVLLDPSLYRRLPTEVVDCHPRMFSFLSQSPEVLVEIWRKLGVSQVSLTRTGERTFDLTDGMGTTGKLFIVESKCDDSAQNRIVMYSEGQYEGRPFSTPVTARCVLLLRSGSMKETNGRRFVAARLDTFVKIERPSVELLAKAVHPWVGKTTDRNFTDTMSFLGNFSYTAERRPSSIAKLSGELENVDPIRKATLVAIARQCAAEGEAWRATRQ